MQTHLLKLEPPYRFIFDQMNGRTGKVIAVLLKETVDPLNPEMSMTISVPIVDLAYTWDGSDLADCMELTYVKNDGKTFKHDEAVLPRSLDYPNIPGLDETDLRNWNTLIDKIITN